MIWFTFVKGHPGCCAEEDSGETEYEGDQDVTSMAEAKNTMPESMIAGMEMVRSGCFQDKG